MRALLDRLIAAIARACAPAYEAMLSETGGLRLAVRVEEEAFCLSVNATAITIRTETDATSASLEIDRWTLRQLILGDCARSTAVYEDRLRLQGSCADLARLDQLVERLVAGAARVPEADRMLDEFLALTAAGNSSPPPGATQ